MSRRLGAVLALLLGSWLAAAPAADSKAPFLWQIQGPKATHFLLGSVHLQPRSSPALPDAIVQAYSQAHGLVFESDLGALRSRSTQLEFASRGRAGPGGLEGEIGTDQYAQTRTELKKLGLQPGACDAMRAWWCGMTVELLQWKHAGFDGAQGIDERLYAGALRDRKQIRWFEPPAEHLGLFTDMPAALSKQFLRSSLDDENGALDSPQALYRAWRTDDTAAIASLVTDMQKRYPAVYERLLAARNRAWMPTLTALLDEPQTQLIVVGAAHCVGPAGLVVALRAKGYVVVPVTTLAPPQAALLDTAEAPPS